MNEVQLATHQYNFISGSMPISVIIQRLVNHGCPNISNRLDAIHCNDIPFSRGGFGDVHQGTLLDGTKVALKCLRLYVSETESNRRALKYAARLVEFRGQIAMVSLWMENGSVDHLDVNNHAIDRCRICFGAAQGLAYLHKIGIVHGDIKGGNIMLSNNNDAQLADFGNAVLASSVLTFTESSAHSRLSTRWAAPEQLLGEATYSRQADIYSLGMTILEIISRQLPYAEIKNEAAVMMTVLRQQHPKRPEDTVPTDSRQGNTLWSLLKSCWNWDPQDRPEAPHIVNTIEKIESGDLLIKCTKPSSLRLKLSLNVSETKRRPENFEGQNLQIKKHQLEMDGSVNALQTIHQHSESKATEATNHAPPWKRLRLRIGNPPTKSLPDSEYGGDDIASTVPGPFSKPESTATSTLRLESSVGQIRNFPSKTCHTVPSNDARIMGGTAPLADFKELMPIGASLGLQSDELDEIEQLVARLQFLRSRRKPNQSAGGTASQAEFEELVSIGTSLGLQPDELGEIEQLVARLQFLRELRTLNQTTLTLNRVEKLILHGQAAGLSSDHEAMAKLLRLKQLVLDGRVLRGRTGGSES